MVYRGQPAGYGCDPSDVINYISAHDNQTVFDNNQYKLPIETSLSDRVRVNNLGLALVALAQGIPFFHAGDELLRSKSFDRNSYNSGDWFNRLDWTYSLNNFAAGLPPEWENQQDWPVMNLFLNRPGIRPGRDQICSSYLYFQDLLKIRKSTPLFRLPSGEEVRKRVKFYNTGLNQQPALIVMAILNRPERLFAAQENSVVVLFNAHKLERRIDLPDYLGIALELHPVLRHSSADSLVKQSRYNSSDGSFVVPPRTAAIFVERR
jgi:pullulanase/glycogen debranching enzyme